MIRIRYKDFTSGTHHVAGFHGSAEACAHGATVYLLPGLTGWQRRAVLRRLRMEASRGYGPALPLSELVVALCVDRVRMALRTVAAVVRLHPSQTLLPSAAAVVFMAFFVLASAGSQVHLVPTPGLDGMVSAGNQPVAAALPVGQWTVRPIELEPIAGGEDPSAAWPSAGPWGVRTAALGGVGGGQGADGSQAGQGTSGGTELTSGHSTPTASWQHRPIPRVERTCFGAMPGVGSEQAAPLSCH